MNALNFVVKEGDVRLDQMVALMMPQYSRSKVRDLIVKGLVTIDGKIGKPSIRVLPSAEPRWEKANATRPWKTM